MSSSVNSSPAANPAENFLAPQKHTGGAKDSKTNKAVFNPDDNSTAQIKGDLLGHGDDKIDKITIIVPPGQRITMTAKGMGDLFPDGNSVSFENTDPDNKPRVIRLYLNKDAEAGSSSSNNTIFSIGSDDKRKTEQGQEVPQGSRRNKTPLEIKNPGNTTLRSTDTDTIRWFGHSKKNASEGDSNVARGLERDPLNSTDVNPDYSADQGEDASRSLGGPAILMSSSRSQRDSEIQTDDGKKNGLGEVIFTLTSSKSETDDEKKARTNPSQNSSVTDRGAELINTVRERTSQNNSAETPPGRLKRAGKATVNAFKKIGNHMMSSRL